MELKEIAVIGLIFFGLLGLFAGIALAFAAVRCKVQVNPTIEAVKHELSGANCGACAYPGCEAYAEAVVMNKDVPPDLCRPGGPDTASRVAKLTGKTMGSLEPIISFRRCQKVEGQVGQRFNYFGLKTCQAASMSAGGPDACVYSCLGFGDCVRACPFSAMYLKNGMVEIDAEKCTGCGVCVKTCPKNVLELIQRSARVMVYCSSKDKGKAVMDVCQVGCIACNKCVKVCPAQVVSMKDGRIHIDHKACLAYGPSCQEVCATDCPRHILRLIRGGAKANTDRGAATEEKVTSEEAIHAS